MSKDMLLTLAKEGSKQAEEQLINENKALVMSIAKRFLGRGLDIDDIFQLGCVGMLKAIRNFDFSYNVAFSTYAVPLIMGEIKRYFRDNSYVKVSRSMKETAIKAFSYREKFITQNGREPTISEIALTLNVDAEVIITAMESQSPMGYLHEKKSGTDMYLIDSICCDLDTGETTVESLSLKLAVSTLDDDEKYIVTQRYYKGKTQNEIAQTIGVSQVQISRREKKILQKLKRIME